MGMKKEGRVGYQVSNKFQLRIGSVTNQHKTRLENTCSTGQVIHRHKSFDYMSLLQHQISYGSKTFQHIYHIKGFKSINIVFDVGKYHRWSNILSTLQVGIKEKIYPNFQVWSKNRSTHTIRIKRSSGVISIHTISIHLGAQHLWVYKSEYLLAYYIVRLFWAQFY